VLFCKIEKFLTYRSGQILGNRFAQLEGLQVGSHDICDTAYLCGVPYFVINSAFE
jgi:hypothetical protein